MTTNVKNALMAFMCAVLLLETGCIVEERDRHHWHHHHDDDDAVVIHP